MTTPLLFKSAAELLAAILSGTSPADAQMERYFRAHPKLGARDRGYIAETVYACLRRRRIFGYLASGSVVTDATAEAIVAACLVALQGASGRALAATQSVKLTMRPPPVLRINGIAACETRNVPSRSMASWLRHVSSVTSSSGTLS